MAEASGLHSRICEVGLDNTKLWLEKLSELGVKSLASLRHIEKDISAYNILAEKAEFLVEKKALLDLLRISESDVMTLESLDKERLIDRVQIWNKEKYATVEDINKRLEFLVKAKRNVLSHTSNPNIWSSVYLADDSIQEFLVGILNCDIEATSFKISMQEIIDHKDISCTDDRSFPQITQMSKWLYTQNKPFNMKCILNFTIFNELLTKSLEDEIIMKKARSAEALAKHISEGFYYLRFNYKETYDDVFIVILVHPFMKDRINDVITLNPLQLKELEFLQKIFVEQRENFQTYEKKGILLLQTYLLLLAMHISCSTEGHSKAIFLKQIHQMLIDLDPPLANELLELFNEYFDGSSSEKLIQSLQHLIMPPCRGRSKKLSLQSPVLQDDRSVAQDPLEEIYDRLSCLTYHEDEFFVLQKNNEAHAVLEKLELCMYYPKKLQLCDALCIRKESLELSLNMKHVTDQKQLPYLIIHKLMSYDCLCRSDLMPVIPKMDESEFDDFDGMENECQMLSSSFDYHRIHPLDCLLSTLLCSDDFLCQDLLSRLAKCQLAVPLILNDPFNSQLYIQLWALCSIIKEWISIADNGKAIPHACPIIKYPMPVITFIRIGPHLKNNFSKSKILNDVISDAHHDYFFHRDCRGGQYKTILGKGLVDMCWYLPSGKPADTFQDAVTFLNLHGDARDYPEQCRFLSKISSMCIALITEEDPQFDDTMVACLTELCSSAGGIAFLNGTEKNLKVLKSMFEKTYIINLTTKAVTRTAAEIKDALRSKIRMKVKEMKDCNSIEDLCHAQKENIILDEDSVIYQQGLLRANKLRDIVTEYGEKKPSVKEVMLPLQGEQLWKAWASNDKELHRHLMKGSETIQEYTAKIESKKNKLRSGQLTHVKNLSSVMQSFIESLLELGRDDQGNLRNYFLQILKLELNSLSRDSISEKQYKYQKIRKELSKIQAESSTEIKAEVSRLQKELEVLQEDIIDSSFGLEHLLRELGQVYEAALEGKINEEDASSQSYLDYHISNLPKAAAELLIDGYPLELMDGDAAHVPLQWVTAVITEAAKILKDPKVFVLSVLGLQSTGKSTMLNTAFGLQFNVSAGRCTRGAFMQLLPLDQELKNRTKCSYVIIVDTEGLRAPELDPLKTQKHDNELATFVIGLANMTLINIYGEVPGDIDDILQTSVHAFLRMNQVRYYPSCQFVHQNAGVNIKGEVSRAKFTQKLNRFTIDAAREEDCEGQFETFNHVIKFNDQTDVHYFPGLWKGDPPMAPVNQGYSQTAQNLKYQLVEIICKRASICSSEENIGDLSLSSFHVKIKDLWDTLLKEKFVFSFKNTLEITAYNSLETAYSTWDWTIQSAMLEWEQKAENEISTEPLDSLSEKVQLKLRELDTYVVMSLYEPVKAEMELFFNGKQSEILIQWKSKFEIRLEMLTKEVRLHAEDHCNNLLRARQAISEFETDRQMNVEFIKKKVQQHIEIVRKEQEELHESLEKKILSSDQIKKILARNLFNHQQLIQFKKDQILTSEQVSLIRSMLSSNKGQLNETILKNLVKNEILTLDQVQKILKMTQQTEKQLQLKFDEIWSELMKELPRVKMTSNISVENKVEKALIKFVEGKGHYSGPLIAKLQKRSLRQRGLYFELLIKEKHFAINSGVVENVMHVVRRIRGTTDQYKIQAIEITHAVFDIAMQYLEKTKKKNTDFKAAYIPDLLRHVDDAISTRSIPSECSISFTPAYRLDVYVTICGYAMLQFEKMAQQFEERNNPLLYLEKHQKIPLFTKFKNQYKLTEAEEAIADTLCAYLEEPIRSQVEKSMGAKMVHKMKSSNNHYFASKMALKVKILTDLHEENEFQSYMLYVRNVQKYLQDRIKHFTIKYCDEKISGTQKTHLQTTAEEEVARLISVVEQVVAHVNEENVREWLLHFCNDTNLRREIGVDLGADDLLVGYDSLQELNVENFKQNIKKGLQKLKRRSLRSFSKIKCEKEMTNWKDQPHHLLKVLIGCTEQCPFCGEQCDLLDHDDSCDHRTEVHRISCLAGWRSLDTNAMSTTICPIKVDGEKLFVKPDGESHPYRDYKTVYPRWFIPPDKSAKSCSYWKWFVGKYQHKLEKEFAANASEVPNEWSKLKWPSIKQDLKQAYNIEI